MKKTLLLFMMICAVACSRKSQISKDLDCTPEKYKNLEVVEDVNKTFKVQLPDNWKTNLYYDRNQSSIFSADTTKQLTNTYTVDITKVYNELKLDDDFIQKFKTNLANGKLVEATSYELEFQGKQAYYSRALGKRGQFDYQICNLFIKINSGNYIHAKAEVYGDSLVNERICNALSLIEKIEY
ncbi:hypothetical protein [Pseudotenacibaculum haliotis]|uniref:Protein involved in gliding motility GldD n=1 Tax=Pseudotenacibaculum haliotis TaxID=1862138 RepID=A0ABW5LV61_9FLAO